MKNIHVLPTDKPSNITIRTKTNELMYSYKLFSSKNGKDINVNQHIYITNDEEIKEGDYYLTQKNTICKCIKIDNKYVYSLEGGSSTNCKKIILTTDQDLIKDGVQAIDDKFLEWFVKNPSCQEVEVRKIEDEIISPKNPKIRFNALQDPPSFISAESLNKMVLTYKYKIIIPKEEPKQETLEEFIRKESKSVNESVGIIKGAKWQQERMYSEEEVIQLLIKFNQEIQEVEDVRIWFEQFKKK